LAAQHEAPDPLARKASKSVFATSQGKAEKLEQLFFSAMKVPAQTK
jgi:hypothetical protein